MSTLSAIVLLPIGLGIALLTTGFAQRCRVKAAAVALLVLWLVQRVGARFDPGLEIIQARELRPLFGSVGISWNLGVDGWTLMLVAAAALMLMVATWIGDDDEQGTPAWLLIAGGSVLGVLLSLNLLLTLFFMILFAVSVTIMAADQRGESRALSLWTGSSLVGLLVLLVTIAIMASGPLAAGSLNYNALLRMEADLGLQRQLLMLLMVVVAAVGGLFPFHGWRLHVTRQLNASAALLVLGSSSLLATWLVVRLIVPVLDQAVPVLAPSVSCVALAWALLAAAAAWSQDDLRGQLAHVSAAVLGVTLAGLFLMKARAGIGAVTLTAAMVVTQAAAFTLVAWLERVSHAEADWWTMKTWHDKSPALRTFSWAVMLLVAGIPLSGAFSGELLLLIEVADTAVIDFRRSSALAEFVPIFLFALPLLVGAVVASNYLWLMGPARRTEPDFNASPRFREATALVGVIAVLLYWGVRPHVVSDLLDGSVRQTYEKRLSDSKPIRAPVYESDPVK